jgi:hypothetical protein
MVSLAALALVVHVSNVAGVPAAILLDAQAQVRDMFLDAGVEIEWISEVPRGTHADVRLVMVDDARGAFQGSFEIVLGAASQRRSGVGTAWVFYTRVAQHADRYVVPIARLLACTIAHELGHVLQENPSHGDRGVMRATWRRSEYRDAARGRLRFTSTDAFAMRSGLWVGDLVQRSRGTDNQAVAVNRR